jgi:hypothetical protein
MNDELDDLDSARGCVNGLMISFCLYLLAIVIVVAFF